MNWEVQDLLKELELRRDQGVLFQWSVLSRMIDREEYYFICDDAIKVATDQSRVVRETSVVVRIEIEKNDKLGTSQTKLFTGLDLKTQLSALEESAQLGAEEKWSYVSDPKLEGFNDNKADPMIWESVQSCAERMADELQESIKQVNSGVFNSAELFISRKKEDLFLSNGFHGEDYTAQIYHEVCFSEEDKKSGQSDEFLVTNWGCKQGQIDFDSMSKESAENAHNSLNTSQIPSGIYSVLLPASDLNAIFGDVLSQLNARNNYFKLPFIEKGSELIPGFSGMPFRIYLDPEMTHTFGCCSYDAYGTPQKKMILIEGNKVQENPVDRKFASYLGIQENTSQGTILVEPQQSEDIFRLRKLESGVLEILQFSGLFTNAMDLTFSSEIRLARYYDNDKGEVRYVKGGSVSGNFRENFQNVKWSSRMVLESANDFHAAHSYFGPSHALIGNVAITS